MAEITALSLKNCVKNQVLALWTLKALVEVEGDIEKAIELLREKVWLRQTKKADRVAPEGLTGVYVDGNVAKQLLK